MKKKNNFSLARVLSPTFLDHNLTDNDSEDNYQFFNSFAGRRAMIKLLRAYVSATANYKSRLASLEKSSEFYQANAVAIQRSIDEHQALRDELERTIACILDIDYNKSDVPEAAVGDPDLMRLSVAMTAQPVDAIARKDLINKLKLNEQSGFLDKIKSAFGGAVDFLRGYNDSEQDLSKSDIEFAKYISNPELEKKALVDIPAVAPVDTKPLAFSNNGVKNMKLRKSVRKTFSNEQACDMLADKLTADWFVCEPECKPIIAEQLKMAKVPAATFAPALLCNRFQYDGDVPVSCAELAALDKVQMFVQALKEEIARGNDCGGIKMVPEAKAFAMKRILKRRLKNFAEATGDLDMNELGTPDELIEAAKAQVEIDAPEKYEAVAEAAEAGELTPDMMGAPAVVAPVSMDPAAMGRAYDAVVDSTIADNSGITQNDMSGYEAEQGQLSLSAAEIGDEMAQAQANAVIVGGEAPAPAPVQPVMAPVAPQNFSRSARRQQMQKKAQRQNFAARPVRQPVQQVQRVSIKGLRGLLGDNYVK